MINSNQLKNKYINLYTQLRNYIWAFETVEHLADLEIAVCTRFPDIDNVRKIFSQLYIDIKDVCEDDEELQAAVTDFQDSIDSEDTVYASLDQVKEVI